MKRSLKRSLVLLLVAALVVGMFPVTAEAAPKKSKKKQVVSVSITKPDTSTLVLKKGKTYSLKTKVTVKNKASKKVSYLSSKKKVATVSSKGKIKALKNGTTKITVKSKTNPKKKDTIKVIVGTPVKKVALNKKEATMTEGESLSLNATLSPKKASVKKLAWSSSNKSVATVSATGVVKAQKAGTTTITVKATDGSNKKATCKVTVKAKEQTPPPTPEDPVPPTPPTEDEYKLVWSDEFSGEELNREDWNVELHEPGWVNAELQEYVDSEENIYLEDGKLVLRPVKTVSENEVSYTSGRVNTQNKHNFTYGKFEVSAKVPEGKGYLPAFWLMAADENVYGQWPRCGEIDIMEVLGGEPDKVHGTIHYGHNSSSGHKQSQGTYALSDGAFSDEFHTYTCEWEPGKITWYVDGVKYHEENKWYSAMTDGTGKLSYPAPFDQPFYIILNLAVGGSWVGYPDETTDFENQTYEIDYVKVYQKDSYDEDVEEPEEEDIIIRDPDANGNYLINGDFEQTEDFEAEEAWQFKTASGGVGNAKTENAIDGKSAVIETVNEGSVDYAIQLLQGNVPLKAGGKYELSFDAYASGERTMKVNSKAPNNGWYAYLDETAALTEEKQTYTYEFDMIHVDDAACTVEFNMGALGSTETIVIDNVSLKLKSMDEDARDAIINPVKTVRADGNYIYNGEFKEGTKHLGYWNVPADADVTVTSLADGRRMKVVVPKDGKVVVSQDNVPVLASADYALSLDAVVPENGEIQIGFDGETYTVPALAKGTWNQKFTTTESTAKRDITITFNGEGTYYLDNVRMAEDAMIANGSFNAGLAGYEPFVDNSAKASYNVDSITYDNAAAFDIENTGDADWKIQLKQGGVQLENGKWYKLSLDAKSTIDRKLMFAIQRDGSKDDVWTPYSGQPVVDLTNEWNTFDVEFEMKSDTDLNSILSISMGAVGGTQIDTKHSVYIDNIKLVEIESKKLDPKPYNENLLKNTAFANDGEGWEKSIKAGTISVSENSITFDIADAGENDYDVQLKQMGIQLESGETYKVSFNAHSTEAREIVANILADNYDWYGGSGNVSLAADETQKVEFEFTMKKDDVGAGLFVSMGKIGETPASVITLSDFSVMKIEKEEQEIEPVEPSVNQLDMNSMINGSWGGAQIMTVSDNSIVYNISDVGTEDSHIQLKQEGITLEKGATYEVSFNAKSTETRDIKVALMKPGVWIWYGGTQVTLDKDAADNTVRFTFTVSAETSDGIDFQISMGQMFDESQDEKPAIDTPASTITLSDFSLIKL